MNSPFESRLTALADTDAETLVSTFAAGLRGVEKEALRIDLGGYLSQKPHPESLGSAMTNRFITTDFSEALLEFVTPAYVTTWEALRCICDIHQFTYENLDDELLWAASMPCRTPAETNIPLARYGSSNVGQMKTAYRRGLGYRYGRNMQTIAGVHFNYSLPLPFWAVFQELLDDDRDADAFRSDRYMGIVRNVRRNGWILLYLFGASPAMCKSFDVDAEGLESLNSDTLYAPWATSLRMSDLGYTNETQGQINIGLNSVDDYIHDLSAAIRTPEPSYEKIGVKVDGLWRQLSANQLQIENEYYSPIRPKRVARSGERPTAALRRGGVEYVEIRSLDVNVFDPSGINQNTMRFIEAFLIYSAISDSPKFDNAGLDEATSNHTEVARRGRDPSLVLYRNGEAISLNDWASEIIESVHAVAEVIDRAEKSDSYVAAVRAMRELVDEPDATPSARMLDELRSANISFFDFALSVAEGHRDYFRSITPLKEETRDRFEREAKESLARQKAIEDADEISFDEYLENYYAGE
ncbi:MAG: glutamate--cysteine ligase [Woeseiaceae bacterium]|nr:glutamate--cysteine ligase [Woeseiaceae bacterium]